MAILKIKNLLLRTIIGFNPHEIGKRQDVLINIEVEYNVKKEAQSDKPEEAFDYKVLTKQIVAHVEESTHQLLECLTGDVLDIVMSYERVQKATVEIDKLHALRFAESVSFTLTQER